MKLLSGILIGLLAAIAMMSFSLTRNPILRTISHATSEVDQVTSEANHKLARLIGDAIDQQSKRSSNRVPLDLEDGLALSDDGFEQDPLTEAFQLTETRPVKAQSIKAQATKVQLVNAQSVKAQAVKIEPVEALLEKTLLKEALAEESLITEAQPKEDLLKETLSIAALPETALPETVQSEIDAIEKPEEVNNNASELTTGDGLALIPEVAPYLFQVAWTPFRSEASASGFATKLENQLGQAFRIIKVGPGQYEVGFEFTTDVDRVSVLEAIARLTGFQSPSPPRVVEL